LALGEPGRPESAARQAARIVAAIRIETQRDFIVASAS
jgi:hypothetical protein